MSSSFFFLEHIECLGIPQVFRRSCKCNFQNCAICLLLARVMYKVQEKHVNTKNEELTQHYKSPLYWACTVIVCCISRHRGLNAWQCLCSICTKKEASRRWNTLVLHHCQGSLNFFYPEEKCGLTLGSSLIKAYCLFCQATTRQKEARDQSVSHKDS